MIEDIQLGLIYARSRNGVIGRHGDIPWYLPEDLAHFKLLTMGGTVIMGRLTWESLHGRVLVGRQTIVLTRNERWADDNAERAMSLPEALALARHQRVWIIGGANVLSQSTQLADIAEVTEIDRDYAGNLYAPPLAEWREMRRRKLTSVTGVPFAYVRYTSPKGLRFYGPRVIC